MKRIEWMKDKLEEAMKHCLDEELGFAIFDTILVLQEMVKPLVREVE